MRFLRRGGRDDELPVERETAPVDDDLEGEDQTAEPVEIIQGVDAVDPDNQPEAGAGEVEAAESDEGEAEADQREADADQVEAQGDQGDSDAEAAAAQTDDGLDAEPAGARVDDEPVEDTEGLAGLVAGGLAPTVPSAPAVEDLGPDPLEGGRPAALRIASLHLRTGQHALARAQLEALAGRSRLDEVGMLDLAEVRWRTGDLAGAGDTANALLARGSESPLALVIAAEAVAAAGRPMEARRLSSRALEVADAPLDFLFAGMPRAMIWPAPAAPEPGESPRRRSRRPRAEGDGAPTTASEAFAGGRAALARGDANRAGLLLGVAMRLEPGFAEDVLRAVSGRDDQPLLALVRGDALRLLGREAEALEAFDRARGRSAAGSAATGEHAGPGLFDEDGG